MLRFLCYAEFLFIFTKKNILSKTYALMIYPVNYELKKASFACC